MRPYDRAKLLFDDPKEFFDILDYCATYGDIISTDEVFVCGYKIHSDYILKKTYNNLDKPNCWYIYLLAGDPKPLFTIVEPLEYICFERFDDNLRLIEMERIKRRYIKD